MITSKRFSEGIAKFCKELFEPYLEPWDRERILTRVLGKNVTDGKDQVFTFLFMKNVYYYDEDKIKFEFPLNDKKVQSLLDEGKIVLMFFFKDKEEEGDERWFTSYDFF